MPFLFVVEDDVFDHITPCPAAGLRLLSVPTRREAFGLSLTVLNLSCLAYHSSLNTLHIMLDMDSTPIKGSRPPDEGMPTTILHNWVHLQQVLVQRQYRRHSQV